MKPLYSVSEKTQARGHYLANSEQNKDYNPDREIFVYRVIFNIHIDLPFHLKNKTVQSIFLGLFLDLFIYRTSILMGIVAIYFFQTNIISYLKH